MNQTPSGSGERLIHLIKLIASGPHNFSLGEFAARAALPTSSVHRLLKILEKTGLVERGSGQSYRRGRELHRIASQLVSRFDLARSARPLLQDLVDRFQETAVLCTYNPAARRAVVAEVVLTPHPLRFNIEKGQEISLPWGSMGRAILAFLPRSETEMVMRTEHTGPLTGRPRPTDGFPPPAPALERGGSYHLRLTARKVRKPGLAKVSPWRRIWCNGRCARRP